MTRAGSAGTPHGDDERPDGAKDRGQANDQGSDDLEHEESIGELEQEDELDVLDDGSNWADVPRS